MSISTISMDELKMYRRDAVSDLNMFLTIAEVAPGVQEAEVQQRIAKDEGIIARLDDEIARRLSESQPKVTFPPQAWYARLWESMCYLARNIGAWR